MIAIANDCIYKLPFLSKFLEDNICKIHSNRNYDAIGGWGHKATSKKARIYSKENNLLYIALEDGFLRSLDLSVNGSFPLSLIVDYTGIYYDANEPSDLENFLNSTDWITDDLLLSAKSAINKIIYNNLSKYNHAPVAPDDLLTNVSRPRILLIDQTMGDASVNLGMADENTFKDMLNQAIKFYPKENIVVKTHPDVIAHKKQGYLTNLASNLGLKIIAKDYAPISLLKQVDIVFTVTSQMGFEGLMLGREVHCFGMPFYAGWGLTNDRKKCHRRKTKLNFEELFAAAYILYPRYVNLIYGKLTDIHDVINILIEQRKKNELNAKFHACLGFYFWEYSFIKSYLKSTRGQTIFYINVDKAIQDAFDHKGEVVIKASKANSRIQKKCDENGVPLARIYI